MLDNIFPKVSVIIPTYNRAKLLPRAIQSVLKQTYQNFEILVIDDFSTDNTIEVVNLFSDPRIKYFKLPRNQGAPAARNYGIKKAKGELIAFLDSDDEWVNTKLEKQIPVFNDSKIGLVYTGLKIIRGQSEILVIPSKNDNNQENILTKNYVGSTSSIIVKKEILSEIGGFDLTLPSCQDWDLFIRLSFKTVFDSVDEPLVIYYEHSGDRISTNSKAVIDGYLKINQKYKEEIMRLSKNEIQSHYITIGKFILKAGITSQDKNILKVGRSLIYTAFKHNPKNIKSVILLLFSINNKRILYYLYKFFLYVKS